ncbi:FGGY-family carbohydrate kinase [Gimesia aquarii]|nr:FGGY-family carbohydrate kinase [Gimesia aquarii]
MDEAILAIDCGTSGIKSTLLVKNRSNDTIIPLPSIKTQIPTTAGASRLVREWEPENFLGHISDHIFEEVIRADKEQVQIVAIAPTTTTSSLLAIKNNRICQLPKPMRWDDRQALEEAALLEDFRKSAKTCEWMNPISADSGIAKAVFLLRTHHKQLQDENLFVLEQWSFLNWWLSRNIIQSESIVSRKWGYSRMMPWNKTFTNLITKELQQYLKVMTPKNLDILSWLKNKMLIGNITSAGDDIGTIYYRVSTAFGLPNNVRIFSVPYDACAQVIGLGLLNRTNNIAVALGTSLGVTATVKNSKRLKVTPAGPIPDTPIPGMQMLFDGFASCGSAIEYVFEQHNILDLNGKPDLKFVDEAIGRIKPGANGFEMLPLINGGRRTLPDDPSEDGGKYSGFRIGIGNDEYVKGLFEAFGYLVRTIIEDFEKVSDVAFDTILAGGGPAKSKQFMQLLSNITNRNVSVNDFADSSLVGCGICAAAGLRWFDSVEEASKKMQQSGMTFKPQQHVIETYNELYAKYSQRFKKHLRWNI